MISHEHRAIFVHIQKTGGDSVSVSLGGSQTDPRKHWAARELRAVIDPETWARYFKFAFVRNPWARLVSWWAMIEAQRPAFDAGKTLGILPMAALSRARTFGEFLQRMDGDVVDPANGRTINIWRNQSDYLTDESGAVLVDFVGRTETLSQDFDTIQPKLFTDAPQLQRLNTSNHGAYADYYSNAHRQLVAERYARDIERFDYQFEGGG